MPQSARDTSIVTYRAKRDFAATPEPKPPRRSGGKALRFVVQKHDARRLHWDFRLEHDGVLWSWAVPKGPPSTPPTSGWRCGSRTTRSTTPNSTAPSRKATTAPARWRSGTPAPGTPLGDPAADLAAGELKFRLQGKRLSGGFVLVRMKPRGRERAENWLLIKEHDAAEQPGADAAALEARPAPKSRKVPDKAKARRRAAAARRPARHRRRPEARSLAAPEARRRCPGGRRRAGSAAGAARSRQLATLVEEPPGGRRVAQRGEVRRLPPAGPQARPRRAADHPQWPRLVCQAAGHRPRRRPAEARPPAAGRRAGGAAAGWAFVLRRACRRRCPMAATASGLFLYVFDLLHLDGWDLRDCRLADRKAALQPLDRLARRAALQRPPGRRDAARPPPGLRDGAGGHHLQACRRTLSRRPGPATG